MIIVGHRGCGYEPENTFISFRKALKFKVDMIEFDVRKTKDNKLVVIHDKKVNRTSDGKGYVSRKTIEQLKKLNFGKKERIPTLKEVFNFIPKKCKLNIEIKSKKVVVELNNIIKKYVKKGWSYNNIIVSSFNYKELKKLRKLNKKIKIGVLFKRTESRDIKKAEKINAYFIGTYLKNIDSYFVRECHKNKIKVFAWLISNKKDMKIAKDLKLDCIFTDFPDKI